MTHPRSRWSFSLRVLFVVVTVLALPVGWFAWQVNWMRQRYGAFQEMAGDRPLLRDPDDAHGTFSCPNPPAMGSLIWSNNHGYSDIWIRSDRYEAERKRIQRLFPEAELHRW